MIVLDEEKFQERNNREKSLQQIIKQQEGKIKELEERLEMKAEHLLIPQKLKYEAELLQRAKEIDNLKSELLQVEKEKDSIKATMQELKKEADTARLSVSKEKVAIEKKNKLMEESLQKRNASIIYENKLLADQLNKLRDNLNQSLNASHVMKSVEDQILSEMAHLVSLHKSEEENLMAELIRYKRNIN